MPESPDDSATAPEAPPISPANAAQREQARKWLEAKWQVFKQLCPICGEKRWTIEDVYQLHRFTPGVGLQLGGPILPVFPVLCVNCGYTMFFNALISGVIQQ